jgi:hypothetical protein
MRAKLAGMSTLRARRPQSTAAPSRFTRLFQNAAVSLVLLMLFATLEPMYSCVKPHCFRVHLLVFLTNTAFLFGDTALI